MTGRVIKIPIEEDRRYRRGLLELVKLNGGQRATRYIQNSLNNGPSSGGYTESAQFFGAHFQTKLLLTVQIVEACEISMPGFGQWLNKTGFGNDKTMIKGFVTWAEFTAGKGKVMTEIGDRAKTQAQQ